MASCFDISIIDAWNTGDEDVTDGSVDNYDFDWGTPRAKMPCGCRRCQPEEEIPADDGADTPQEDEADYPMVQP